MIQGPDPEQLKDGLSPEELRILLEISESLHRTIDLDEMLGTIISRAKYLMRTETVSVILHDPARDELFFRCTEGNPEAGARKLKEIRIPAQAGIAGRVFQSGEPELVMKTGDDPDHFKAVDKQTKYKTQSLIAAPLSARGRRIGVIESCNKLEGPFTEKDLGLLILVSHTVSMAIDNARIHEELKSAYEELQVIDKAKDNWIESAREENARLRREIEGRHRFHTIRGNSPEMLEVLRLCDKAINSDISVLIQGETGTGKELIARCLHYSGQRKDKSFVIQNCGGIPESLLASELFGYKRGAFTGALTDKKGLFEVAHEGTIFLDEVGEMSTAMQVSILRVLQEGEVRPLGSTETRKVNVRVVSATSRDLEEDVRKGLFREDLLYRLNVFPIRLPPLRERSGDVALLANYFIQKFRKLMNKAVRGLSEEALRCLCAYSFPGNVRELENEMERAMVLVEEGKSIQRAHLSHRIARKGQSPAQELLIEPQSGLKDRMDYLEKDLLRKCLERHQGNKTRAAQELGLSRFGLIKKLKRFGME